MVASQLEDQWMDFAEVRAVIDLPNKLRFRELPPSVRESDTDFCVHLFHCLLLIHVVVRSTKEYIGDIR